MEAVYNQGIQFGGVTSVMQWNPEDEQYRYMVFQRQEELLCRLRVLEGCFNKFNMLEGQNLPEYLRIRAELSNISDILEQMQQDLANGTRRRVRKNPSELTRSQEAVIERSGHFEVDEHNLIDLGFTKEEICVMCKAALELGFQMSPHRLVTEFSMEYDSATKINYLFNICTGKVKVNTDSEQDIIKHCRFMFGKHKRIGIKDLSASNVEDIPRRALVAGIPDGPFAIWNSNRYSDTRDIIKMSHKVIALSGSNVVIETDKIPVIANIPGKKANELKRIDGLLEIKEQVQRNGKKFVQVSINRDNCRLCNRFVIVASMKRPDRHLGMREMICFEGTKVYVFADLVSGKRYTRYGTSTQRVYDFGYSEIEIESKLVSVANRIYKDLKGVWKNDAPANVVFERYEKPKTDESGSLVE